MLPQCSDGLDNNDDLLIDILDPNCHINGNINNEYVPLHNSEIIPPVVNTSSGQGGIGNEDLGYLFFKKFSLFRLINHFSVRGPLLSTAFKLF